MSAKLSALPNLGGIQVPTDLAYVVDVSAGAGGSTRSTLNDLFAIITKNITDGAVRFQGFAAPALSGAGQGAIYFDSTSNTFKFSENAGAYRNLGDVAGPSSATDKAIARFNGTSGKIIQNSVVTVADATGNMAGVGTLNTHTIPGGTDTFALLAAVQTFTNKTITASNNSLGGVTMTLGSDATGDVYFRNVGGQLARLAIGTTNQVLTVSGGLPSWQSAGAPGGSSTQVQFNNGGAFGGITGVTSDGANMTAGSGALRATSPLIITGINDSNGNQIIGLLPVGSAVSQITVANAASGGFPTISVTAATGTNIAGISLTLSGGPGTGNAVPGQLVAKYPLTTTSGSSVQSLSATAYPIQTHMFADFTTVTTVSNTTTETSLLGAGDDGSTKTIEAGLAKVGRTYRLTFRGRFDRTLTPTLDVRIKLGSVTFNTYQPALSQMVGTASEWFLDALVTITAVGAAGQAVMHVSKFEFQDGASGPQGVVLNSGRNRSVQTIDFTAAQTWVLTVQWGTASASNAFTYSFGSIDIVR